MGVKEQREKQEAEGYVKPEPSLEKTEEKKPEGKKKDG